MTRRRRFWRAAGHGLRNLLLRNFWLKLLSLLIALGFYGFIHGTQDAERTLAVPLITYMPPANHARQLMTQIPNTISVTVSGLKAQLDGVRGENVGPVPIDLTDGTSTRFEFEPAMLSLPPRVTVKRIVPAVLELKWEEIVARRIPVQLSYSGELDPTLQLEGESEIEPVEVEARGPASLLNLIHTVRAADFDLRGLGEGELVRELALERAPDLVRWDVTGVVATVRVARKSASKTFERIKVEVIGLPRAVTRPALVDVTVRGLPEVVARLRADAIVPKKGAGDWAATGSQYLDVLVGLPGIEAEVVPAKVLVKW
jgi:hypothetical protein